MHRIDNDYYKRSTLKGKPFRWILICILIACAAVVVTEFTNTTHLFHAKKAVSGLIKTIKVPTPTRTTSNSNDIADAGQPSSDKSPSDNQNGISGSLLAPYGGFVSNHKPGQSGTDMTELSQCITTPGVTCYIKFTQGNVVKTLPQRTADSSGSIFWEWNVNDAGLTSGKWTITAIASMNSQTKSTTDQLDLEVQ